MSWEQVYVLLVLLIPLSLVFMGRLRDDVAALLMAALLGLAQFAGLGVLGPARTPAAAAAALTGFGTPEVITLLALFVLTTCLEKYGVAHWIAEKLLSLPGRSERSLIGLFALAAAVLSLFMNTLAAGALLLPSALDAARRTGIKPSKLLIPVAYGAQLGGAATYLTTANIVTSALLPLAVPPQQPLGFLDFLPVGGLAALAGLVFLTLFGKHLLPDREPPSIQVGLSSDELSRTYQLQNRLWEAEVSAESSIANQSLSQTRIGETLGMAVLGVRRGNRVLPVNGPEYQIVPGDSLLIIGREERARQLEQAGLQVSRAAQPSVLEPRNTTFVELLVPPRSNAEGKTLRELAFRAKYGFTAVAIWRGQQSHRTDVASFKLRTGDTLLLMGPADRLKALHEQRDFIVVEAAVNGVGLDGPRVAATLVIVAGALAAMFLGMPIELAMIAAMVLILLTGLMKPDEAYGAIKWRAIFLIAGTISVSVAMVQTDLAQVFGDSLVGFVAPWGPLGLVAGVYLLSALVPQLMGGQVSPLVVGPIAISAAIRLGVNPQAIAVVSAMAGSIAFITPLSHPVNILMIAPANYTFGDFVRSGWGLSLVCFAAVMIGVPLFWHL
jgi:di/tricarboxylate transporter